MYDFIVNVILFKIYLRGKVFDCDSFKNLKIEENYTYLITNKSDIRNTAKVIEKILFFKYVINLSKNNIFYV